MITRETNEVGAWTDAGFLYAFLIALNVVGVFANRADARDPWLALGQAIGILLVTLAVVIVQRHRGHPYFPIGSIVDAIRRIWWVWMIAFGIAVAAANLQGLFFGHSTIWYLWLATGVLLASVAEEFAFRGAIQTSLNRTRFGRRKVWSFQLGTIISALLFSSAHFVLLLGNVALPRVLFEVFSALPLALVTGYIYQRTSNLWYGVFLHALGNLGGA